MGPIGELDDIRRVRLLATQTRLQVLRSELSLALTFCAVARTEIAYGQLAQAQAVLRKAQHTATSVRSHIDELYSFSAVATELLIEQLLEVENRILEVQGQIALCKYDEPEPD